MAETTPQLRPIPLKGPGLTTKVVVLIGALVALFMAGFGVLLHGSLEDTIREQLYNEAINAARTAAQVDLVAWTRNFGTIDQGLTGAEIQARVDSQTPEAFQAYDRDPVRRDQIAWNAGRAKRVLGEDTRILAVEVFRFEHGTRWGTVAAAYPSSQKGASAEFETIPGLDPVVMGLGEAQEGLLTFGEGTWRVIRGSYPIVSSSGDMEGEVVVHVHADAIADAAMAFSEKVSYAAVFFILVSILVATILARILTSPMRRLRDDAAAVAAGDLHHRTHPHSTDEVGQLARTFEFMTRWLARAQEAEEQVESIRADLEAAAEVTASLFPKTLPSIDGWTLGGIHDREATPGGGTYDVLMMPDGKLGMFVAEASSAGAPGALVAAMARSALRFAAESHDDPGAVLREANARLAGDLSQDLNVAAVFVVVEPATGRVSVASAGHRPVLHYHSAKDGLAAILTEGPPLGTKTGADFSHALKVVRLTVEPGDSLVMFASAISLLSGKDGEVLGEKRLAALVKQAAGLPAHELVERVGAALRNYHGGDSLGADVTLVAVSRQSG